MAWTHPRPPAGSPRRLAPRSWLLVGINGCEIYEVPGAISLITAHQGLEDVPLERELARYKRAVAQRWGELVHDGLWFSPLKDVLDASIADPQQHVSGEIRMVLRGGRAVVNGRRSEESLHGFDRAAYDAGDSFGQRLAGGLVQLWGLPRKIATQHTQCV